MELLINILLWVSTVVGAASLIVVALIPVAALTKTKKDDTFLAKANTYIKMAQAFIGKIALNPKK